MTITPELPAEPQFILPVVRRGGLFTFWCEWCRRRHWHGGTGHRIAHCTEPASPYFHVGYVLIEVPS